MRIALLGFLHESNTFLAQPTTYADFENNSLTFDQRMIERWTDVRHEIGGMIEGCHREGIVIAGGMAALSAPSGTIEARAFARLANELLQTLGRCGEIDGVLMALHGATVSETFPDADGEILRRVRAAIGPKLQLISTLDLHANVSEMMVKESNALIAYRSNPHIDQYERGVEAAILLGRAIRGEVQPVQAMASPPLIFPIAAQDTNQQPASGLYSTMDCIIRERGLLSASTCMGFYYSDVQEMGATFLALADGDRHVAQSAANQMAHEAWSRRAEFITKLPDAGTAIKMALESSRRPVVLLDVGDNVGGGSAADSTILLRELLRRGASRSVVILHDPEAAAACAAAGVRSRIDLFVGAKKDDMHGEPVHLQGHVRTLSDGIFIETEVRHAGWSRMDQGLTAVVSDDAENLVVLTSLRVPPFSLEQLKNLGIHPERMSILVTKGVIAPRAAYAPIAGEMIVVDTPGSTSNDPARFVYNNRRTSMFPLELDTYYEAGS